MTNKPFNELTDEEQNDALCKADTWNKEHRVWVEKVIKQEEQSYAPSQEDAFRPELWKPAHWKWFEEVYYRKY